MIRVLHIMSTVTGGGVERRRLSLAKAFKGTGFQMKLIGTFKSGNIAEQIEENDVEIIEIGDFKGPFHWSKHKKVQKIIDDFKPHIIHGAVFEGVTMAAINGFIKRVPIVIIEETSDPQNRSWKANLLMKLFSVVSHKAVAISPNAANYLVKIAKISPKKVITINNGVEIPRQVSETEIQLAKEKYNILPDDFIVGTIGRLFNEVKRFTDIISAIALLPKNSKIKLLIVGGGPDEELMRQKVEDLGATDQVIFTGYQFDTALYYQLMNVFCIASRREGFGLVAAEAMLHQLPVIATRVGGLQNVVVDEETGILIHPHQPQEIADAIKKLYDSTDLVKQYSHNGYNRALENYTEERYVNDVIKLYRELLKKKNINA